MTFRKFADSGVAEDWACPECGATKADFTAVACALS